MSDAPLRPARPDAGDDRPEYAPRFPWKWLVLVALGFAGSVVAWNLQSGSRLEARREALLQAHRTLAPARERHEAFLSRLQALITGAAASDPENVADARLRLSELHRGDGLYLRIPREAAQDPERLSEAAKQMDADAITRCLGIGPTSLRGFFEIADFLGARYQERVRAAQSELVLSALENEMNRHAGQDLAASRTASSADYLLVALEHGDTRSESPVDVFLWRLSPDGDERLLSARVVSRGVLVPARIALPGVEVQPVRPLRSSAIADDCSIAAQLKELTGEPAANFASASALEQATEQAAEPEATPPRPE